MHVYVKIKFNKIVVLKTTRKSKTIVSQKIMGRLCFDLRSKIELWADDSNLVSLIYITYDKEIKKEVIEVFIYRLTI